MGRPHSSESPGPPPLDAPGPQAFPQLTSRPPPVHPSKVSDSEKSQLVNETRWQYYGTPGTQGNLTLTWNTSALPSDTVTIELWGYEETGEAGRGRAPDPRREPGAHGHGRKEIPGGGNPARDFEPEGVGRRGQLARAAQGGVAAWVPGLEGGWRRCRRSQLLDTWLVLEIGKTCPAPSSEPLED